MTLQKYTDSLPKDKQFQVAIRLTKLALPIWDNYADKNVLEYRDTVVGLIHSVDRQLLSKTIDTVDELLRLNKSDKKLSELRNLYDDPIVAIQDTDWELPDQVESTFYSVFNLLEAFSGKARTTFDELTIYVSINQAVDALVTSKTMTVGEINSILDEMKNGI